MKRSERHVFLQWTNNNDVVPLAGPDDQSGRVQTSVERFARIDLVLRFFDFKRAQRKN
ncbi:hypothetical protein NXC14_CH01313 [Rhizobium sp. NXC14]|nr:hypothetical protein NXC14_CH01313 [Rhizobium sp. NXC14]